MNNALTADDLSDLAAVLEGATNPDGSRRNLRASELDDGGARLAGLGFVVITSGHVGPTETAYAEAQERGI